MAATRVRVGAEFRNGDGHFIQIEWPAEFEPCSGVNDLEAMERAFVKLLETHFGKREAIAKMLDQRKPPGHD